MPTGSNKVDSFITKAKSLGIDIPPGATKAQIKNIIYREKVKRANPDLVLEAQKKVDFEQHPDIGNTERIALENLSNNPEAQVEYLKKEHPKMQVELVPPTASMVGYIRMKNPGEKTYKVLNPPMREDTPLPETLKDIAGSAYDVGAGYLSALAGGSAGLAAAPSGPGSIAAASATSGLTGAALEGLRQKLGKMYGIPQEYNKGRIATAGVVNALFPLALGTGSTAAKQAAKAEALGIAPEAVAQSQKGIVGRLTQKFGPSAGEMLTGSGREEIAAHMKNTPEYQMLQAGKEPAVRDMALNVRSNVKSTLGGYLDEFGRGLENTIDKTGAKVDISPAKNEIDSLISKIESGPLKDLESSQEIINELKGLRDSVFVEKPMVTQQVEKQVATPVLMPSGKPYSKTVTEEVTSKVPKEMDNYVSPSKAFALQAKLNELSQAYRGDKSLISKYAGRTMSQEEKRFGAAANRAYNQINSELERVTAGESTKFKEAYKEAKGLQEGLNKYLGNKDSAVSNLSNIHGTSASSKQFKGLLKRLNEKTGLDVSPEVDAIGAFHRFDKPSFRPVSGRGSVSTGLDIMASGLGAHVGMKAMGGLHGAIPGAAAARFGISPAGIKYMYSPAAKLMSLPFKSFPKATRGLLTPEAYQKTEEAYSQWPELYDALFNEKQAK